MFFYPRSQVLVKFDQKALMVWIHKSIFSVASQSTDTIIREIPQPSRSVSLWWLGHLNDNVTCLKNTNSLGSARLTEQDSWGLKPWNLHFYLAPQMILRYHRHSRVEDPSAFPLFWHFILCSFCWFSLWFSGLSKHVKKFKSLSGRVYMCHIKINNWY